MKSDASKKLSILSKNSKHLRYYLVVIVFILIGTILLIISRAAVSVISYEPENGTTSGNLMVMSDSSASNSKATYFGMHNTITPGNILINSTLGSRYNQYSNDSEAIVTANLTIRGNLETNPAGTNNSVGQGQFRIYCQYSHLNYDDPIVFPGQAGKAHLHLYWGNTKADASTTTDSLLNTGGSSCEGYEANRTAYWMPAVLDGSNKVVIPKSILMYYKSASNLNMQTKAMPQGLKMIAGNSKGNDLNTPNNVNGIQWECYTGSMNYTYQGQTIPDSCPPNTAANAMPGTNYDPNDNFPINLIAVIYFPSCDAVNPDGTPVLDSTDHKSHLAYFVSAGNGNLACPSTHPFVMPQLSYHISWPGDLNYKDWHLSSDRMTTILPDGSSLHADWYNGWNKNIIDHWTAGCINPGQNCGNGVMGSATGFPLQQLKTVPSDYTGPNYLSLP